MKLLNTRQVVIRIAVIITVLELLIMLSLGLVPDKANAYFYAFLDVSGLVLLSTPLIYLWVIKPFVNARDEALAKVDHLAHIDPLTQLANRRLLEKNLEKDIVSSAKQKYYRGVLLVDLDGFKQVNDNHGHETGDAVLFEIGKRLQSITRAEDIVGRLGGDEFVVLINRLDTDKQKAREKVFQIANKLIDLVCNPIDFSDKTYQISASIGIRLVGFDQLDVETVLREADTAMYRAKQAGRGCALFFED